MSCIVLEPRGLCLVFMFCRRLAIRHFVRLLFELSEVEARSLKMANVDNGGYNLEEDISAKLGGYRKEYESGPGRDRGDYGKDKMTI